MEEINSTPITDTPEITNSDLVSATAKKIEETRSSSFRHRASVGAAAAIVSVAAAMLVEKLFDKSLARSSRREARKALKGVDVTKAVIDTTETPNN